MKTRRQVDPARYKSNFQAWSSIYKGEGLRGVFFGWTPTFAAYSAQGAGKYGFYEVFKYWYGDRFFPNANKTVVYLAASASAEFLADIALCPFEAIKVRMQTTLPPYASTLREGWSKIVVKEGYAGYVLSVFRLQLCLCLHEYLFSCHVTDTQLPVFTRVCTPSGHAKYPILWSNSPPLKPLSTKSTRFSESPRRLTTVSSKLGSPSLVAILLVSVLPSSATPLT